VDDNGAPDPSMLVQVLVLPVLLLGALLALASWVVMLIGALTTAVQLGDWWPFASSTLVAGIEAALAVFVVRRLERSADWTRSVWMLVAFVSVFPLAMFNAGIWVALHAVM
jgi:hypothetical protein